MGGKYVIWIGSARSSLSTMSRHEFGGGGLSDNLPFKGGAGAAEVPV
jgi:hypothetical protein